MKNIIRYIFCNDSVGELYMGDCKFPDWMDNGETIPLKLCSRLQSFERLLRWLLIFGKKKIRREYRNCVKICQIFYFIPIELKFKLLEYTYILNRKMMTF